MVEESARSADLAATPAATRHLGLRRPLARNIAEFLLESARLRLHRLERLRRARNRLNLKIGMYVQQRRLYCIPDILHIYMGFGQKTRTILHARGHSGQACRDRGTPIMALPVLQHHSTNRHFPCLGLDYAFVRA